MRPLLILGVFAVACNQPPEGGSVSLSPETPTTVDDLVLDLSSATDPNKKDEVTYSIRWLMNNDPVDELDDAMTVPASRTRRGQVWSVQATPSDGKLTGPVHEAQVTIVNAPPVITSLALSPSSPRVGDTITVARDGTDADEDILEWSYAWTVNGAAAGSGETLSSGFVGGDEIALTLTLSDGEGGEASQTSSTLTVANSPPEAPIVQITPVRPSSSDDLVCRMVGEPVDPDGDALEVTMAWERDGVPVAAAGRTDRDGDTVLASQTASFETWLCEITVSDGQAEASASNLVEVLSPEVLLIWDVDGPGTTALVGALEEGGLEVTLSDSDETGYTGANPAPDGFDAVIHLNGTTYTAAMPEAGQAALVSFVEAGGGYVHGEWNAYEAGSTSTLSTLYTFVRDGGFEGRDVSWSRTVAHPVTANVGDAFTIGEYCGYNQGRVVEGATSIMTLDRDGIAYDAVAVMEVGSGRSVGFAHAANYASDECLTSPELQQLYLDAVMWSSGMVR